MRKNRSSQKDSGVFASSHGKRPAALDVAGALRRGRRHSPLMAFEGLEDRAMLSVSALGKASSFQSGDAAAVRVAAAASNDTFANAIALVGAAATGTNVDASREAGEPNIGGISGGGKSVWWAWTATSSGTVQIDTIGSMFNTTLGVYVGSTVGSLSLVAGDDDSGGSLTSKVSFAATAGTTYSIGVDGYGGRAGSISLHVVAAAAISPPTNVSASDGRFTDRVQLTWTAAVGATGYEVWKSGKNDSASAVKLNTADVTGTSYADTTGSASTISYYWVKAKAGSASSSFSVGDSGYRLGPANDSFAGAIVLTGSSASTTGTNVDASREAGEPNIGGISGGGKSVWWAWTATSSGTVQIDTIGSTFDTMLGVYDGSTVGSLSLVAGDDDSGGSRTSKVSFAATAGTTYRIAVDGYGGASGSISLHVIAAAAISPPTNVSASDGSFTDRVQLTWTAATGVTGYEVWRSGTSDSASAVKLNTADMTGTSYTDTTVSATTIYYYWVKAKAGGASSGFSVGDSGYRLGPANDSFSRAIVLTGSSASTTGTNVGASSEVGEPNIGGISGGGKSVWWAWTATSSGTVQIDTIGSMFNTTLGVYVGSTVGSLSLVAGDDDSGGSLTSKVSFAATAGTTYRIAVDGYGGASGSIVLHAGAVAIPAPANVSASDGGFADRVQLTWTAASGATSYEVWRSGTNDSASAVKLNTADVTGTSYADTTVSATTIYYYWVKAKAGGASSGFSVGDSGYRLGPANDSFSRAIVLTGSSASTTGTNVGASSEVGEPNIGGISGGGKSVWWAWTATSSGTVQIDTIGSMFNTTLGVYVGSTVGSLSLVAGDDDSGGSLTSKVSFAATAGTTYRIAVDGYAGATGTIVLRAAQVVAPAVATPAAATINGLRTAALSVLGSDASGESGLTYTWSVSTMPSGAPSPSFSINATNTAKATTVTFGAAGNYVLTARIGNGAGLSVSSDVSVTLSQSLAAAVINPVSPTIAVGAQQQFTVQTVDQFGKAMASQPAFTWAASSGTMNAATGLYTAPATAGTVTITASSGSITATTTATISGSNFLGLQNADLARLVQSLYSDGSLNRLDMYEILVSVGRNDGSVTASEISDLRSVLAVSAATTLKIPGYVQVLANDVVSGNPANARYQGQSLGNLAAGFTVDQMTKLVDKWFKGSDRPTADANGPYSYRQAAGSLFVDGPSYTDSHQGYLGDCYFLTTIGSIAKSNPVAIQNMFIDNGDGTFTVRFYAQSGSTYTPDYVTVDRYLPASGTTFIYSNMGSVYSDSGNELWMPLAEKAYAQWNETGREGRNGTNTYSAIEGGWMGNVNRQVLGRASGDYAFSTNSNKQIFIDAINANKGVSLGTSASRYGLYGSHAYMVVGYSASNDTFQAYNPWGNSHPGPLTWSQLQQSCSYFCVADTSNVPSITLFAGSVIAPSLITPSVSSPAAAFVSFGDSASAQVLSSRAVKQAALARIASAVESTAAGAASVEKAADRAFATWERTSHRVQIGGGISQRLADSEQHGRNEAAEFEFSSFGKDRPLAG